MQFDLQSLEASSKPIFARNPSESADQNGLERCEENPSFFIQGSLRAWCTVKVRGRDKRFRKDSPWYSFSIEGKRNG
jgi:hypothetical protein